MSCRPSPLSAHCSLLIHLQAYKGVLASPTSPLPYDISNTNDLYTDWMTAVSPASWAGGLYDQASSSSSTEISPFEETSWSPFEENFATTAALDEGIESMDFAPSPRLNNQGSTNVNGFSLKWPPRKQNSTMGGERWAESASTKHARTEENYPEMNFDLDIVTANVETNQESQEIAIDPVQSPDAPSVTSSKAPRAKRAKKEPGAPTRAYSTRTKSTNSESRPKPRTGSSAGSASPAESRTNHNMIEKQYRNRLNLQFESLLETLPKGVQDEKRVGKAEVLVHANQYIQKLEKDLRLLEERNLGLEGCVKDMEKRWMGRSQGKNDD